MPFFDGVSGGTGSVALSAVGVDSDVTSCTSSGRRSYSRPG